MSSHLLQHAKILIVDDEIANVRLLEKILQAEGYHNVSMTTDSRDAAHLFTDEQPDLVLLDLNMPYQTGYDVMATLGGLIPAKTFVPIIVLTADVTPAAERRALGSGASDFICKPFDTLEVALRIKNQLRMRFLQLELDNQNRILEQRVQERTESLQKAMVALRLAQKEIVQQERLRALGMMATGIVHDFNNVLSVVTGYSELLLKESNVPELETITKYLQTIVGAARDGAEIVNRLDRFQRPPSNTDMRQAILLAQSVNEAVDLTMPRWKEQKMKIDVIKEFYKVPEILGDPVEIRELLTNLIFNAVDAMPKGGTITFRTLTENQSAILEIEDTGTGMTEEVRERCLEPFFTTKGEDGSGLGLAMVYGIIQRHGGILEIKTVPGRGAKFRIQLPPSQKRGLPANDVPSVEKGDRPLFPVPMEPMLAGLKPAELS